MHAPRYVSEALIRISHALIYGVLVGKIMQISTFSNASMAWNGWSVDVTCRLTKYFQREWRSDETETGEGYPGIFCLAILEDYYCLLSG